MESEQGKGDGDESDSDPEGDEDEGKKKKKKVGFRDRRVSHKLGHSFHWLSTIDNLRKSRGLHSVRAFRHGPACGCSAE